MLRVLLLHKTILMNDSIEVWVGLLLSAARCSVCNIFNCYRVVILRLLCASALVSFLLSCSYLPFLPSKPCEVIGLNDSKSHYPREVLKNADWSAHPEGLSLDFTAASNLNTYQRSAHSLIVKVFLLSDKSNVSKVAATSKGIGKLLSSRYSHASIIATEQYTLYPGDAPSMKINRDDQVKYVAIVAGFSKLIPSMVFALELFPIKNAKPWYNVLVEDQWQPQALKLEVVFGSQGFRIVTRKQCQTI
jgi:predicted component of type VI protein secretion system